MTAGGASRYLDRPRITAAEYGLPMGCQTPSCDYRWLKLPGLKMRPCPNCGKELVSLRPRRNRK